MKLEQLGQSSYQKSYGMNLSDIALLLGFVGIYDLRVQVDELKVRAWAESLDSDMSLDEAKKIVSWHYANSDQAINPSHLNRNWRIRIASERERQRGQALSREFEEAKQNALPYDQAQKYLEEIRKKLHKGNDASLETDNGQLASDL
jgi:predicted NodU family carbamoyl transferase